MKRVLVIFFSTILLYMNGPLQAQDELLDLLEEEEGELVNYAEATFKSARLINGHSIETRTKGTLEFMISHRFGRINSGAYEFFGLDGANVRFGLEYGLTKNLNVGVGRNSFEKTYDGFLKYKLLRQRSGARKMPVSAVFFTSMAINTLKSEEDIDFSSRLAYSYQLLMARKFSERLSLQVMPTMIHRNEVTAELGENDLYAIGAGGRLKLTRRLALNAEYYYRLNALEDDRFHNALAIGFDIETGGHVFQLHFTNAQAMIEKGFVAETTGDFFGGDIHFGFNISRVF